MTSKATPQGDRAPADELRLAVDSIDLQANGVARHEGKIVFVRGALPGERVRARIVRRKPRFDTADTIAVERESSQRVTPRCPHFGVCGGCSMQHLSSGAQLAVKQRALEDQFTHLGNVRPGMLLRPIAGPEWGYRYRARLSVRYVARKGGVLIGFHEKGSSYVADMRECHVLPSAMSDLLLPLRALVEGLSIRERLPQIEVAIADRGRGRPPRIALVLRVLVAPNDDDDAALRDFASRHGVQFWLQSAGPDSIQPLVAHDHELSYALPEFGLTMPFRPTDFTQVNPMINGVLVGQAVRLLEPRSGERIADLFCGLGNFSLPIARRGAFVTGVEGSAVLCARAHEAARANGLDASTRFLTANLFETTAQQWLDLGSFDRVLVDPPREGAQEVCRAIAASGALPKRIVYVSCNPATLARDASVLVHAAGMRLASAGAVDMFPHTSHVESIAVFERP